MKQVFPKDIYVAFDEQSDGTVYMLVDKDQTGHAAMEKSVKVGVYRLVRVATLKNTSVLE